MLQGIVGLLSGGFNWEEENKEMVVVEMVKCILF